MRTRPKNRGQSLVEFTLLIATVIGAVMAMQLFMKRGLQGRMFDATNSMTKVDGGGLMQGNTSQYEPYYNKGETTIAQSGSTSDNYDHGTTTREIKEQKSTETGTRTQGGADLLGSDSGWR